MRRDVVLLPPANDLARRLQRIEFWCSPDVASSVRSCTIYPSEGSWDRGLSQWAESETPDILLDALLLRLDRFTGLRKLKVYDIQFTQARVDILHHLPNLHKLHISDCPVAPGQHIAVSPLTLCITNLALYPKENSHAADEFWYDLVQPDQLRVLEAHFRHVRPAASQIPIFPRVHTLRICILPEGDNEPSHCFATLSNFPGVRSLRILARGLESSQFDASALLPVLEEYFGEIEPLPLFLSANSLRRVQICKVRPEHLIALTQFRGGHGHKITALCRGMDSNHKLL
ncbi:hypothetical protein FB45DRAFT_1033897 [Roridomyces roridus]|uniref:Uncharacterized protein n=1 Tax=Roridomyces roridus TaxID=1738132 RepID=A0AAD7BEE2_9AGAR|nr:hypothetical protein FB45DRAFT_1033897 [Roridomyces roridus]